MSFASRAREEIAQRSLQKDCCVRAAAYGFACFAKYLDKGGLVLQTEQPHTVQLARELFARCGVQGDVLEKQRPSGVLYEFNIRAPEQVARMHELFGTTGSETSLQIDPALIRCQTCVSAYIGAAFLCSGTVTDPQKEYHLEFSTPYLHLAEDLVAVLHRVKAAQLSPSIARRKNSYIVYIKESAAIEDFLTLTGAVNSAMNLMQIKMYKETYNNLNRVSNCETANLDKTYSAATKQIAAIALISDKVGLDELPADLREAAVLRLENPEMSLREMGERLSISRSGVNHRLRRILEFAEQLGSPEESLAEQSVFEVEEKLHAENAKTEEL